MNKKPIQLILLAIVQFLTPVFNVGVGAFLAGVKPWTAVQMIIAQGPTQIIQCLALGPILGIAILMVRKWSLPIILGGASWAFVANVIAWRANPGTISLVSILSVNALPLLLAGYFLLPSVRVVYMYPLVRWWEAKPRYTVAEKVAFSSVRGKDAEGLTANISEGGLFLQTSRKLSLGKNIELEFEVLDRKFKVEARPVYNTDGAKPGYGMQFEHTSESRKALRSVLAQLDRYGVARTPARRNIFLETVELAKSLAKGQQFVPVLSPVAAARLQA